MKYKCVVFDHDDTTVNSTAMIHYPCFVEFMSIHRPDLKVSLEEYYKYNFNPGVAKFFKDICGLSDDECKTEQEFWFDYASKKVADAFPGIKEIMENQRKQGGLIAVISHSFSSNILRDYEHNGLPIPDDIFGWDQPKEERKPSPYPLFVLMKKYGLKPNEILVLDDMKPGLDMARAAGCDFAASSWCFHVPECESYMRKNADYFLESVEDLAALLNE